MEPVCMLGDVYQCHYHHHSVTFTHLFTHARAHTHTHTTHLRGLALDGEVLEDLRDVILLANLLLILGWGSSVWVPQSDRVIGEQIP